MGDHGAHESCPCLGEVCTEGCHKVRCTCQGGAGPLCRRGWNVEGCGQPHQGCSHLQVGSGHHEGCGCEHCCCHRDCLLVLHWGVHRQGQPGWLSSLRMDLKAWCSRVFTCKNKENSVQTPRVVSARIFVVRPCR